MVWFAFAFTWLVGSGGAATYRHSWRLGSTTSLDALNRWKENEASEPPTNNGTTSLFHLQCALNGTGITSLLSIGQLDVVAEKNSQRELWNRNVWYRVLIGTKRGDIVELAVVDAATGSPTVGPAVHASILNWYSSSSSSSSSAATGTTRFPIYSLAANNDTIFAGSGDRYISLWPLLELLPNAAKHNPKGAWWWGQHSVKAKQRLGPHTGWVKALAFDSDCLYSIGCNRIETWTQNSVAQQRVIGSSMMMNVDIPPRSWTPAAAAGSMVVKSCVEPNQACTLSSDLLCLATCRVVVVVVVVDKDGSRRHEQCFSILAVGGVDGRIHFYHHANTSYYTNGHQTRPCNDLALVTTMAAHQGRVTALRFVPEEQILISASHDGTVHCWSLGCRHETNDDSSGCRLPGNLSVVCVASVALDAGTRITALDTTTCHSLPLQHQQQQLQVLVGTHNGQVIAFGLQKCCRQHGLDSSFEFLEQRRWYMEPCLDDSLVRQQPTVVHAVCALSNQASNTSIIVVGHSHGIEFLRQE
jgi:WD domain, G-beta repeat